MEISQVKIFPVHEEKLKAFVSIVIDHCFMVNDIKIIQGKDGLFLSMPSRRKKNGEFKDVAHPLNNETRRLLEERVLAEYREIVDDQTPRRPDHDLQPAGLPDSPQAAPGDEPLGPQGFQPQALKSRNRGPRVPATADESEPVSEGANERPAGKEGKDGKEDEQTLEEVERLHLRDSFWTVS